MTKHNILGQDGDITVTGSDFNDYLEVQIENTKVIVHVTNILPLVTALTQALTKVVFRLVALESKETNQ